MLDRMRLLHEAYLPLRHEPVPFPVESAIVWYFLFALQDELGIRGDILELGVQHGGTAFLAASALASDERLTLVDLERTAEFAAIAAKLPDERRQRIEFHTCSTRAPELDPVAARRFQATGDRDVSTVIKDRGTPSGVGDGAEVDA